ncbi:GDP-mannose 4,6-dehydratase [Pontiella sulfatireligans]|uniref:GDP-mannose 4,6-dehydratase n=1 Tax=Pontiella sulfatireligans TaxID=2750658 RepID=A0A6C2ULB8_9BACT|nr:GDP-mannose 4,6-dehydratase [Pontiella sulfatireligans]VGO21035.1 GDP-mannose 4,6-dehydratase [Pontiella sulfatireligans]
MKKALITGVNGQDGSYLVELLLEKGYEVHGIVRRTSSFSRERIDPLYGKNTDAVGEFVLHYGDMSDEKNLRKLVEFVRPDEVYHLASQSHVGISFNMPEYSTDVNALGTLRLLEAIHDYCPTARFYQASTSELFGNADESPLTEQTRFKPNSPYAVAKLYAYWMTVNYRQTYGMYACNGILFNHESPRRGENFVTRKITQTVARIALGLEESLSIGNMNACRDWGYAPDYVRAMWLMLQQKDAVDYVIATGESHSVRELIEKSFAHIGTKIKWSGEGADEQGVDAATGKILITVNPKYYRPIDVDAVLGDASKARNELGWEPQVKFDELVGIMMEADLAAVRKSDRN